MMDETPATIQENAEKLNGLYTKEQHIAEVKETYVNGLFAERAKELNMALTQFKAQLNNEENAQ